MIDSASTQQSRTLIIVVTRMNCTRGNSSDEFTTYWSFPSDIDNPQDIDGHFYNLHNTPYDLLLVHGNSGIQDDELEKAILNAKERAGDAAQAATYSKFLLFRHPQGGATLPDSISFKKIKPLAWRADYSSSGVAGKDPTLGFLVKLSEYFCSPSAIKTEQEAVCKAIQDICLRPIPQIVNGLHDILNLLFALRLDLDRVLNGDMSGLKEASFCFKQIATILLRRAFSNHFRGENHTSNDYALLNKVFCERAKVQELQCRNLWTETIHRKIVNPTDLQQGGYASDLEKLSMSARAVLQGIENYDGGQS